MTFRKAAQETAERASVHERVTNHLVAVIERGDVPPWRKPWSADGAGDNITLPLRVTGEPYKGINRILLWCEALEKGYDSATWMTFKHANDLGGKVRKGEHAALVVYWGTATAKEEKKDGSEAEREIHFAKGYSVFNVDQIDGLPDRFKPKAVNRAEPPERIEIAEAFIEATKATFRRGGNRAYYSPATDHIQMPPREAFRDAESEVATALHEIVHWSSHPTRLNRELGKRFGDKAYFAEEMIAELGSAFLCADIGVTQTVREDHASYLASWINVMKADSKAIFTAAGAAQKAVDFLMDLQPPWYDSTHRPGVALTVNGQVIGGPR